MKKDAFTKSMQPPLACSNGMEWRNCAAPYSSYWVSEYGDVVATRGKSRRLKGFLSYDGYPSYRLTDETGKKHQVSAHRLVALAFIGAAPDGKPQVRHKNGSRLFCHYSNIAWASAADNRDDTRRHGTSSAQGERNPKAKINEFDVIKIRKAHRDIKEGRSKMKVSELARMYGLHTATVCNIARKKTWKHIE